MVDDDSSGNKNNDEAILHVIGIAAGVSVGLLVLLSFLPAIILAAVITIGIVWAKKKQWLNYALYGSIIAFVVLILTGTWREAFQFAFLPFELFSLEQFLPRLESALNKGQSFQPGILTFIYFIILAIVVSRIAVYFHERFQSRIVHSKKDEKAREKETLQYQKVKKNWLKLNAKNQRSWRKNQSKKNRINEVLLGINQIGDPFKISYDELKQHTLAVGTTGSGKTTALYSPLETALKNQDGFVMIDGKGDPETIEQVQSLFNAYGRKLHVFHSSNNLTYNPLKNGGHTAGTNHLFNAFDWSEQFYKNVTKEHTQNVMAFLDDYNFPRDLKHIGQYLELENIYNVLKEDVREYRTLEKRKVPVEEKPNNKSKKSLGGNDEPQNEIEYKEQEVEVIQYKPSERAAKYMNLLFGQEEATDDEIQEVIKNASGDLKKFIRGMSSQLNYLVNSEIGYLFEDKKDGIDLADIIAKGEGVIFSLNSNSYKDFIMRLGRFIVDDVATVIQEQGQHEKNDALGIFDEFDSYGNERITDILAKSRSANFRAVISVQSLAQLKLDEGDITQKVIDTCNTYFFGKTNDPTNAEYAANIIGTQEDEEQTFMTKEIGPGLGRLDYKSDYGTIRKTRNYYFHPDQIKELMQGEFIVSRKAAKDIAPDRNRSFVYFRNPVEGLERAKAEVS